MAPAEQNQPLMFGPASDEVFNYFDLDGLFDEEYFPDDVDFSTLFDQMQNPTEGSFPQIKDSSASLMSSLPSSDSFFAPPYNAPIYGPGPLAGPPMNLHEVQEFDKEEKRNFIQVHLPISIPNVGIGGIHDVNVVPSEKNDSRGSGRSTHDAEDDDGDDDDDDNDDDGNANDRNKRRRTSKYSRTDIKNMTHQQKKERRERNREHAKRSRIRKKVLLDSLQDQLHLLRSENASLRMLVAEKVPHKAQQILSDCTTEESLLLSGDYNAESLDLNHSSDGTVRPMAFSTSGQPLQQGAKILVEPDFRLIQALITSQQNFVVSDPSLPDNPIVYASEGFCKLSGYKRQDILGRNCRFLQGPGTDQAAVDIIRKGVDSGCDISVCLLNYKADGSPFWNQFFVAPLKDSDGQVVNYVGVQCEVNTLPITELKDRVKRLPMPDSM